MIATLTMTRTHAKLHVASTEYVVRDAIWYVLGAAVAELGLGTIGTARVEDGGWRCSLALNGARPPWACRVICALCEAQGWDVRVVEVEGE